MIEDSGLIDLPGTEFINNPAAADQVDLGSLRSDPAVISLSVLQRNDAPVIPPFADVPVQTEFERSGDSSFTFDLYPDDAIMITPGPLTALDELDQVNEQTISITVAPFNVPGSVTNSFGPNSLLMQTPTLTANGVLTVFPTPDAFGVAVLEVQVTDVLPGGGALPDSLTTTRLITITIDGTNDPPVAQDREFTQREAIEASWSITQRYRIADSIHEARSTAPRSRCRQN